MQQKVPDETTVLHFRRLLETHELAQAIFAKVNAGLAAQGLLMKTGTIVDATILPPRAAPRTKTANAIPG